LHIGKRRESAANQLESYKITDLSLSFGKDVCYVESVIELGSVCMCGIAFQPFFSVLMQFLVFLDIFEGQGFIVYQESGFAF